MDTDAPRDPRLDPIGVFDSGIGGLTVAAALKKHLPSETIFYIGDTARVPYGGKSRKTVERYGIEIGGLLLAEQAKMIVVACNTASALAVPRMKELFKVPVQGVIVPGAAAALRATRNQRIGVIGTRATIASGAYE
ncbi:MAG: glutamate racemase, partial [Terrimicrobiaceae bacterium]